MSDPFVGEIRIFAFNWAPYQWAPCNGQVMAISQNQALFALIGTIYGGNGTSTFQLPNLQSRLPMHMGQGLGLSAVQIGEMNGVEQVSLTIGNMPAHTHVATFTPTGGGTTTVSIAAGNAQAAATVPTTGPVYLAATGNIPRATVQPNLYATSQGTGTPLTLGGVTVTGGGGGGTVTNQIAGSSLPTNIRNPYLGLNFCISLFGIFPSRN